MRTYHQLTQAQRYQIYALQKTGHSGLESATVIGVHKSSVSRELKRNRGQRGYRPQQAQSLALERRQKGIPRITVESWALVEKLLKHEWSPEQISGRLKKEQGLGISHEWIYQYVLEDKRAGGDLYRHLRCQKKRRTRYGKYDRGANCLIAAVSKSLQPLQTAESVWATGKSIPCSEKGTHQP